jgi:hypothetical protein
MPGTRRRLDVSQLKLMRYNRIGPTEGGHTKEAVTKSYKLELIGWRWAIGSK